MIQKTTEYTKSVKTMPEAWQFIMKATDEFDRPRVIINPVTVYENEDDEEGEARYDVMVAGVTELPEEEDEEES